MKMEIKLSNPKCMPTRANEWDAGLDLVSTTDNYVEPYTRSDMIDTGVAVAIPNGYVGLVFSRSGMGKVGVRLSNCVGVIDSGYTGNIKVLLQNDGDEPFEVVKHKTKIAQLVVVPVASVTLKVVDELQKTDRGDNGFGSSDAK